MKILSEIVDWNENDQNSSVCNALFWPVFVLGEIMQKVEMTLWDKYYCGGNEFWLNFKQGENNCSIKKKPSSTLGTTETWKAKDLDVCKVLMDDVFLSQEKQSNPLSSF